MLGVVGENGSGKYTTMNLLAGALLAHDGRILLDGNEFKPITRRDSDAAGIALVRQQPDVFPNLSVAENLFLPQLARGLPWSPFISRTKIDSCARRIFNQVTLRVLPTTLAGTLSSAERQLLEIARGLAVNARVFIFDEPTTSLTAHEAARMFAIIRRLKDDNVAVLYISNNLDEVLALSDDIMVLRDGRVALYEEKFKLTASDLVLAMVGQPTEALFEERPIVPISRKPVLEICGVSQPGLLRNINIRVGRSEIVGIAGVMGSGRSALARVIFGLDEHRTGTVSVSGRTLPCGNVKARLAAGVAFVAENRKDEGLMMEASIADNMALAALPVFASGLSRRIDRNRLSQRLQIARERLGLRGGDLRKTPVKSLSGANQLKALLARWLLRQPRLFILDEPTRGIDVGAKQEIYRLLTQMAHAGMALLVISSELEELLGLCDRILVMRRGEVTAEFPRERFDRETILRAAFGQGRAA